MIKQLLCVQEALGSNAACDVWFTSEFFFQKICGDLLLRCWVKMMTNFVARGGGLQGRSPSIVFNERQYYQFRSQLVITLHKLHARLLRVRHGKHVILQHTNTSLYTSQHTVAALERLNFEEILPHPSQIPIWHLVTSSFYWSWRNTSTDTTTMTMRCKQLWVPGCRRRSLWFHLQRDAISELVRPRRLYVDQDNDYAEK